MNVKQKKQNAVVLAATIITVLAALFALTTVTSNAADINIAEDDTSITYNMTNCTYDQQITLSESKTNVIRISGDNKLTYGGSFSSPCITGDGDLMITGEGTLEIPDGYIYCKGLTIEGEVKLKDFNNIYTTGNVNVNNAEIESKSGGMNCGGYGSVGDGNTPEHVFKNAIIKSSLALNGISTLTDCTVALENATFYASEPTINGGTYNFHLDVTYPYSKPFSIGNLAKVNNAVIKANSFCYTHGLVMTNSYLEITIPEVQGAQNYAAPALEGYNMIFSNSKIKIDGNGSAGIQTYQQLTMTNNTEMDIKSRFYGIVGKEVSITHSSGTFQATDPDKSTAAVASLRIPYGTSAPLIPGTLKIIASDVKEPAGGTIEKVSFRNPSAPSEEAEMLAITTGKNAAKTVVLEATHSWDAGKVTKEPTETAEGVKTFTCTICGATRTEAIPNLAPQKPANGEDGTPFGKGASVEAAEAAILALPNDDDPAGTAFGLLQLKATKVTKNSINLKWKAVPGATKYIIFANKCGTGNKYKRLGEVTGTSFTATQADGAAIHKGTYYKFMMIAADANGKVVSTSKTVHAATKGGKIGNHKKVTIKKSVIKKAKKLKKGKTLKLKAKAVPQAKKLKVRKHRGIKYESSNPAVAQVNGKGTVKGVGKGTCYVYAYAQNGTCAKVKVTVK